MPIRVVHASDAMKCLCLHCLDDANIRIEPKNYTRYRTFGRYSNPIISGESIFYKNFFSLWHHLYTYTTMFYAYLCISFSFIDDLMHLKSRGRKSVACCQLSRMNDCIKKKRKNVSHSSCITKLRSVYDCRHG